VKKIAPVLAVLCAALVLGALRPALADPDPNLSYDDPAMHYSAPDGWTKIDVPPSGGNQDGPTTVAAFTKEFSRYDKRSITIRIEPYSGTLDGAESSHESELRSSGGNGSTIFVDKKTKVTLPNGMPAWFLKATIGSENGDAARIYEYVLFDGKRQIIVGYAGKAGNFDDKDAVDAFKTLSVVLYPAGR
jgi:hypothetical protein